MGRVRGKGKKQTVVSELRIGEEEKIPTVKKRGRPQKAVKDNRESNVSDSKFEEENGEAAVKESTEDTKSEASEENGGRKRRSLVKDDESIEEEEEEEEEEVGGDKVMKSNVVKAVGFRPNGNRRKNNTPRRAAEVGVECQ